jgi:hypothetical protein
MGMTNFDVAFMMGDKVERRELKAQMVSLGIRDELEKER